MSCSSPRVPDERASAVPDGFAVHDDLLYWPPPRFVNVEVTNDCDLSCVHCYHSYFDFPKGRLHPRLFEQLEPLLLGLGRVSLSGAGEPLLARDFDRYLDWCLDRGLEVIFTTHGHFLDRHVGKLLGRPVLVTVSMDAGTPETYRRRRGASFERLLGNLEALVAAKRAAGTHLPALQMNFVAGRSNVHDLPHLIDLAARLGVGTVYCFHQLYYTREHFEQDSLFRHQALFDSILAPALEQARELGVTLLHPGTFDGSIDIHPAAAAGYLEGTVDDFDCKWVDALCNVAWNGIVQACCFSDQLLMGNLAHDPFDDVWNGPRYRELRLSHVRRRYPSTCRQCIFRQALTRQEEQSFQCAIHEPNLYTDDVPPLRYRIRELDPLYRQACRALAGGAPAAALAPLHAVLGRDENLFEAANALGVACALLGRTGEARAAFDRALQAHPASAVARDNVARLEALASDRGPG